MEKFIIDGNIQVWIETNYIPEVYERLWYIITKDKHITKKMELQCYFSSSTPVLFWNIEIIYSFYKLLYYYLEKNEKIDWKTYFSHKYSQMVYYLFD